MAQQQIEKQRAEAKEELTEEEELEGLSSHSRSRVDAVVDNTDSIVDDIDDLLADIDEVLEKDAFGFVAGFVQRNGE